ncbi:MAG: VOC family protein, partial [Ktedonobacteraceae bacterium]|nr:VOC family protein [Ktedonobacteraceae bacterium]
MQLSDIIGEYGLIVKLDVSDLDKTRSWYADKLGLKQDSRFDTSTWVQLFLPKLRAVAIGLNLDPAKAGKGNVTFVVDNIESARDGLVRQGVEVGSIQTVVHDVRLAFFKDPDGNSLTLRQNPPGQPTVSAIWQEVKDLLG